MGGQDSPAWHPETKEGKGKAIMTTTDPYYLSQGSHQTAEEGRCAMEWVSFVAGEKHSDSPSCVDWPLKTFCVGFNDVLDDDDRQGLRPYLARCIGTAGDGRTTERAFLCFDWAVRTYVPTWLALAGLDNDAARLRALPPIVDLESARRVRPVIRDARHVADVARGQPSADPAWSSAMDAARVAVRDTAGMIAMNAAMDAIADEVMRNVGTAALEAALNAARSVAVEAVRSVGAGHWWSAAHNALVPTVSELQRSAFRLLDRMLPLEPIQIPARADVADALCRVTA